MASPASNSSVTFNGEKIEGCFLDVTDGNIVDETFAQSTSRSPQADHSTDPSASPLPVTLRIYLDQSKHNGVFRLYTFVELLVNRQSHSMPLYLDIAPDQIRSLSVDASAGLLPQQSSRLLCFRFDATRSIKIVAPQALPPGHLQPKTYTDWAKLQRLRFLARQPSLRILLPPTANDIPFLACCEAISVQHLCVTRLQPDPSQVDLRSLYRGKGGRLVSDDEMVIQPPGSSLGHEDDLPAYNESCQTPEPCPFPPTRRLEPAVFFKREKRKRVASIPSSNSSSPDYRVYDHFNLAVGEREKMMAELLRRVDKEKAALNDLMAKTSAEADRLTNILAAVKEHGFMPQDCGMIGLARHPSHDHVEAQLSRPTESSATPSASSEGSLATASVASDVSERVQNYINKRIAQLRNELEDFVTADNLEDQIYGRFVEADGFLEAIENTVDECLERVRDRVLSSWL